MQGTECRQANSIIIRDVRCKYAMGILLRVLMR